MKKLLVIAVLCLSGCSASGYGVSGSVAETDRWEAYARAVEADAAARKPTLEIVQYREDGITPASKVTMDLGPILGKRPVAPKGPVAEAIEAVSEVAKTPVAALLGASVLVGQANGNSTSIQSSGGATSVGSGTSGVSAVTEVMPEGVVAE